MTSTELLQLIDHLIDGQIDDADFLRLEAELHVDAQVREVYYERMQLHGLLEVEMENASSSAVVSPRISSRHWTLALIGLGLVAGLVFLGLKTFRSNEPLDPPRGESLAFGFAVLTDQSNADWLSLSPESGDLLAAGNFELSSGVAQVEFFSGVIAVVEGPAHFELVSSMEMKLHAGKLRVQVPEPAQGFRVRSSDGEVVDLGTEFAMSVDDGETEMHVFDGEIEWHPRTASSQALTEGEAIRWTTLGASSDVLSSTDDFVGPDELALRRLGRREQWQLRQQERLRDPRLLFFFTMGQALPNQRMLPNLAGPASSGAIVLADSVPDRWGHPKSGLDFSHPGSRIRVHVPGRYPALSLLTWVKIDSLDRWYNSLFLTDGHELHEPHWQIMDDGRMFFSVKRREAMQGIQNDKHIFYSPPFWSPALSGAWLQLATTYDPEAMQVTHFLNGEVLSREPIPEEYLVESIHIGHASLCNWSQPKRQDPHFAIRNLNGSMDEFSLYREALSPKDVQALYEQGRP